MMAFGIITGAFVLIAAIASTSRFREGQISVSSGEYTVPDPPSDVEHVELWYGSAANRSGESKGAVDPQVTDGRMVLTLPADYGGGFKDFAILWTVVWSKRVGPYFRFYGEGGSDLGVYIPVGSDRLDEAAIVGEVDEMLKEGRGVREIMEATGVDRAKLEHIAYELGRDLPASD